MLFTPMCILATAVMAVTASPVNTLNSVVIRGGTISDNSNHNGVVHHCVWQDGVLTSDSQPECSPTPGGPYGSQNQAQSDSEDDTSSTTGGQAGSSGDQSGTTSGSSGVYGTGAGMSSAAGAQAGSTGAQSGFSSSSQSQSDVSAQSGSSTGASSNGGSTSGSCQSGNGPDQGLPQCSSSQPSQSQSQSTSSSSTSRPTPSVVPTQTGSAGQLRPTFVCLLLTMFGAVTLM